jgi:dephospho-CoA kinase
MVIIGLTGSIGMGKSTAAKILRGFGLPVYNADRVVHVLLHKGGAGVKLVAKIFPAAFKDGAINRKILGGLVFHDSRKLKRLEKILHPRVRKAEHEFLQKVRKQKMRAAVLEIPLLFETGADRRCDVTLCVTAPKAVQTKRVMRRPGMTPERFKSILAQQMPDRDKRQRADYVIQTGKGLAETKRQLKSMLATLTL